MVNERRSPTVTTDGADPASLSEESMRPWPAWTVNGLPLIGTPWSVTEIEYSPDTDATHCTTVQPSARSTTVCTAARRRER